MLVSKFFAPVTRYMTLRNLNLKTLNLNLVRFSNKNACSGVIRSCKPTEKTGGYIRRSRCAEYKAAVANCPKTTCQTVTSIPTPKCNSQMSESYLNSLKSIEDYAKKIAKLIEEITSIILQDVESAIQQKKTEESSKRQNILKSVEAKVCELINLDAVYGMKKKWKLMMINDKLAQELKFHEGDISPNVKFLGNEIKKFTFETKCYADNAITLIKNCRRCSSPISLRDCIKKNTEAAFQILDKVNTNSSRKIANLHQSKSRTIKEFGIILEEITESYRREITKFSEDLNEYAHCLKKKRPCKESEVKIEK